MKGTDREMKETLVGTGNKDVHFDGGGELTLFQRCYYRPQRFQLEEGNKVPFSTLLQPTARKV